MEHNPITARDLLEQALHKHRVHDGFEAQRRALAVALDVAGISPQDIDLLAESIAVQRKKDSDGSAAILFSLLRDPKVAAQRLADVRKGAKLREASTPGGFGRALFSRPQTPQEWDALDRARAVVAWARSDRKTPEQISSGLGIPLDQVAEILRRENIPIRSVP